MTDCTVAHGSAVPSTALRMGYLCGAPRVTRDATSGSVGPRAHVTGFLAGLAGAGVDTQVYLAGEDATAGKYAESSAGRTRGPLKQAALDVARIAYAYEVRRRARDRVSSVDIVYERLATFQAVGRPYQRRGTPWVVESNGPFWYEASSERSNLGLVSAARRMELDCYRRADLVVAVSEALKGVIVEAAGVAEDSIIVLPNATDPYRFDPSRTVARRLQGGFVVGFVGYVVDWAGLDLLVRAVASCRRRGAQISAVVVGDGPALPSLRALVTDLGVHQWVHFTGRIPWDDVPDHIAGFDVAYSGQRAMRIGAMYHSPQKLYEYQAMGVPVIASDHADARTLLKTGFGWLFEPDCADGLVEAIERAREEFDDPVGSARARRGVLEHHSWQSRVLGLLQELRSRTLI